MADERAIQQEENSKKGIALTLTEKRKWKNRERVMVFCSRGASYRDRHLMEDFRVLLPHSKNESKMDKNLDMQVINEICEMRNCSKCLYFETRKKKDAYLWVSNIGNGPSAKFLLHNISTMGELKMSGNCLRGSRPILSFSQDFDNQSYLLILKELFIQIRKFGSETIRSLMNQMEDWKRLVCLYVHSVSVLCICYEMLVAFSISSRRMFFILGPRMVLDLIGIFGGSFGGQILYQNPDYINPNIYRSQIKMAAGRKYVQRLEAQKSLEIRKAEVKPVKKDPLEAVFETAPTKRSRDDESSDGHENILTKEATVLKTQIEKRKKKRKIGKRRSSKQFVL